MTTRHLRRCAVVGFAALAPLLAAGAASAGTAEAVDRGPRGHVGDPRVWGPPREALCDSPGAAAAAGYAVRWLTNNPDVFTGNGLPEAIYARGGNDTIRGGGGNDLICLGYGHDRGWGEVGNDAVFGEEHNDVIFGNLGRDYLDGGTQIDVCDGGLAFDAASDCETVVSVP